MRLSDLQSGDVFSLATSPETKLMLLQCIRIGNKFVYKYESLETGKRVETSNDLFIYQKF